MAKKRSCVPAATKAAVLKEFSHLCAICGAVDPQIHHIDENPENNSPDNLLPLCANHHLTDQHNPTRKIEPGRLRLFREHKDPAILKPQFAPLYRRLVRLARPEQLDLLELIRSARDLGAFVAELEMGAYYASEFYTLLEIPAFHDPTPTSGTARQVREEMNAVAKGKFGTRINDSFAELTRLTVELLRYQNWPEESGAGASVRRASRH